jgi:phosphoribosyl 1,2-cyclic phosphodiesterase
MAKQGISVSFRLHPSDPREKQAIEIIQEQISQGLEPRQFITDAILRSAGYTPEMFRDSDAKLTPSLLESILEDFGKYLLSSMRAAGGAVSQETAKPVEFDEDEDAEMAKNLAAGWAARNGRK